MLTPIDAHEGHKSLVPDTTPETVAKEARTSIFVTEGKAKLTDLRPHPENEKIYGDKDSIADLVDSIKERGKGILEPLLITPSGDIVGGHRRYRAAQELGLEEVPVRVFDSTDDLEIGKTLLEHNRQRIKTGIQIANEATFLKELNRKLREREKQKQTTEGKNLPPPPQGKTRDNIGKTLGVSGRTVDKAVKAAEGAVKLRAEGKEDDAAEVEAALQKSIERGLKVAKAKGAVPASKAKKKPAKKNTAKVSEKADDNDIHGAPDSATVAGPTSEKPSEPSAPPPPKPTPPQVDSDAALTHADHVITFLRSESAKTMKDQQRRDWTKALTQIVAGKEALSL
jgi:ParB-like chromosome segregation protein Spo0J